MNTPQVTESDAEEAVERLADNILESLLAMDRSGGLDRPEEYNRAAILDRLRLTRGLPAKGAP